MAKASKYNRARIRSRVRRPKRRAQSRMWTVVTAVVVVVGVLLVVLSYSDRKNVASAAPKIGDHWHAYLGVNVCGTWLPNAPAFESSFGLHSHGDGLMHIHPFTRAAAGDKATVGRFLSDNEGVGWKVSQDAMKLWDGTEHTDGKKCGKGADAKPATVQWKVGHVGKPWPTATRTGDPSQFAPKDGSIVALYFAPKGTALEQPPGAEKAFADISDPGGVPPQGTPTATTAPVTTPSGSTATTGAAGTTTP